MTNNTKKDVKAKTAPKVVKGGTFGYEESKRNEILRKTANIFEKIKGTKINIRTMSRKIVPQVYEGHDDYGDECHNIIIGRKELESSKTTLERGLSYIAFDTSKNIMAKKIEDLSNFAKDEHVGGMSEYCQKIYDSLEAKRVFSCMGTVFKGFQERCEESDEKKGEKLLKELEENPIFAGKGVSDPLTALRLAQYGMKKEVEKSEFSEALKYIEDVKKTAPEGSLLLTEEYMNDIVKPWYLANFANAPEQPPGQGQGEGEGEGEGENQGEGNPNPEAEGEGKQEGEGKGTGDGSQTCPDPSAHGNPAPHSGKLGKHKGEDGWKGKKPSEKQLECLKNQGYTGEAPETKGDASDLISKCIEDGNPDEINEQFPAPDGQKPYDPDEEIPEPEVDGFKEITHEANKSAEMDDISKNMKGCCVYNPDGLQNGKDETFGTLDTAKQNGEKMIEELENKMDEALRKDYGDDGKTGYKREHLDSVVKRAEQRTDTQTGRVLVDTPTVNRLKQLFKQLKSKRTQTVSDTGMDIDLDLYIKNRTEGGCDFLLDDDVERGFAVVIGIDESASMGRGAGSKMDIARTLCGTLFKAFDGMPNVEIHVIGWTSQHSGVSVHLIKKFEDVKTITATGGTPFTDATIYCGEYVAKLPQKRKLFFQITDGDIYVEAKTKAYLNDLRKRGIIVKGLQVGSYGFEDVKSLFGKENALSFRSMYEVNKVLTREIANQFVRYMAK